MGRRLEQTFLQRRHRDGHRHMKRYSTSIIIIEIQTETTTAYQLTLVGMANIKSL